MKNKSYVWCVFIALCIVISCINLPFAFAENLHTVSDNKRALPTDMGESIIAGQLPLYVDYACGIDAVSTRDVYPTKFQMTNGNIADDWFYSQAKFADYNDGDSIIYKNGEAFCNITFKLKKSTDITGFCLVNHSNPALVTAKYEIHASKDLSYLFTEKSKIAEIDNTKGDYRQLCSLDKPVEGANFFAVRIISPVQTDSTSNVIKVTETANHHYPRISELAAYGVEQDTAYFPAISNSCSKMQVTDEILNTEVLDFKKSIFYGVKETVEYNRSGVIKEGGGNSNALTDGDVESAWHTSTLKFAEIVDGKVVTHRDEEKFYSEITLDAGRVKPLELLYIKHHTTEGLETLHYKVYAAETKGELGKESSLIADCYNSRGSTYNFFTPTEDIKVRYLRIRVLDPCYDYSSKFLSGAAACNYAYPRFCEIAAFTKEDISGSLAFKNFAVHGNSIGAVKPGTEVKALINNFTGLGDPRVVDKDMNLKVPTDKLEVGDKLIADTSFGNTAEGDIAFYGDPNSTGTFTVSDVVSVRRALLQEEHSFVAAAGDTDCNGELTVSDILRIVQLIVEGTELEPDTSPSPDSTRKYGIKTDGVREVVVDTDVVLNDNFYGLGTNSFASVLSPEATETIGINKVYNELNKERLAALKPKISRMWFQVDWMITDSETDTSAQNVGNNKDRLNYINGIYDFDSVWMQSFYEYAEMLKEIDCQIEINFGWKTATRIKEWFNAPTDDFKVGAPKDLDAFAKAAAALVGELRKRGFDNVKAIAFYNEPNGGDFELTEADERLYWSELIKVVDSTFRQEGIRDTIEIWGPEVSGSEREQAKEWFDYQLQHSARYIDQWTGHHYYNDENKFNNYSRAYDTFRHYAEATAQNFMVTEFYGNYSNEVKKSWYNWNDSTTSYFIAVSNTGTRGALTWSSVGGYLPDPLYMNLHERDRCAWQIPCDEESAGTVNRVFYEQSLLSNYIPYGSKVLYTDWTGDDIKTSAYLLPDGNLTILVESNGIFSGAAMESGYDGNKTVKITINDGIDRTFKRISYIAETQEINANATLNSPDKTIEANDGIFTDSYGKFYSAHIYTTAPIKKQLEMEEVFHHIECGDSVKLSASLIDCEETDEIVYSITETIGCSGGSISEEGIYTAPAAAEEGAMVAVRASLKSDPSVFAVNIIYVS